ncbi:predicted protein [Streptomyces viridosporus ATCC 14672]|uniref:Predicted protein n=2 Tax=Streptomyces viridosporus TaxID=67581 RepID=D5ZS04_STRV1|nr:predicted protein [Streptomyces viridosporus ATCC 14672]
MMRLKNLAKASNHKSKPAGEPRDGGDGPRRRGPHGRGRARRSPWVLPRPRPGAAPGPSGRQPLPLTPLGPSTGHSLGSRGMANTQGPQGHHDPAGSTQMFRAFVDEAPQGRQAAASSGGPRIGLIVGVVVAVAIVAAVAWLALK